MRHELVRSADGNTVWVNSGVDGSSIGRFSKKFGIDVHRSGTDQAAGKGECLYCTHEPAGFVEWTIFRNQMLKHHGVHIPVDYIDF